MSDYRQRAWNLLNRIQEANIPLVDQWYLVMHPQTRRDILVDLGMNPWDYDPMADPERLYGVRLKVDTSMADGAMAMRLEFSDD